MEAADLLARCAFPSPGTTVDCAVSGGPDSLALLVLAVEAGLMVTAWHVDHGLRPGSDAEGERVAVVADSLGAAAVSVTAMVGDGPNLEARAREARLDALPDGVLTGHTADDQAETVLLNLLRGSGVHGSAGIGDPGRRPLLGLRRSETRALCVACGLEPLDDPMNDDPRFVRNRIRNEVLPLLAEVSDRDPVPLLARHAGLAGEAVGLLDALIADIDPTERWPCCRPNWPAWRCAAGSPACSADGHPMPPPSTGCSTWRAVWSVRPRWPAGCASSAHGVGCGRFRRAGTSMAAARVALHG